MATKRKRDAEETELVDKDDEQEEGGTEGVTHSSQCGKDVLILLTSMFKIQSIQLI